MDARGNTSMCLMIVIMLAIRMMTLAEANGALAPPTLLQQFTSSSGKTVIQYYNYDAGPCGAGPLCNFRGFLKVPPGYDQAEVFISGFKLEALQQADAVSQLTVRVSKHTYNAASGVLDLSVAAGLATRSGQKYSYSITFVVLLTGSEVAQFSPVNTGCAGIIGCKINKVFPTAVPAGMQYIGLATQNWALGSHSGPLTLNTISGHVNSLTVQPPLVNIEYGCEMTDRSRKNRMFCEWAAKVIAFDPAEMEQNGSLIFPQYFIFNYTNFRQFWTNNSPSPSHKPIAGFLDAFEGLTLTYDLPPYTTVRRTQFG